MALDYDSLEELEEDVFPVDLDEKTELDRYGVWIKQKAPKKDQDIEQNIDSTEDEIVEFAEVEEPLVIDESYDDVIDIDDAEELVQEEIIEFDDIEEFNELPKVDMSEPENPLENSESDDVIDIENESLVIDEPVAEKIQDVEEEIENGMEVNDFETLDLDDFLNDDELTDAPKPEKEEQEDDLSVENASDNESVSSDELEETSEFDDLLSDLGADSSDTSPSIEESSDGNIDMNITIDEDSDISSIAGKTDDSESLDAINIFGDDAPPKKEEEVIAEEPKIEDKDDDIVIESTIIEADNMDAIREENEKILNQTSEKPEVEDEDEINSLDSMLDDVMGISSSSAASEVTVDDVPKTEEPMFEISSDSAFDDMEINFEDVEDVKEDIPENIQIPDESSDELPSDEVFSEDKSLDSASSDADSIYFDDIEALEQDMLEDESVEVENPVEIADDVTEFADLKEDTIPETLVVPEENPVEESVDVTPEIEKVETVKSEFQNDKATEILMQIAGELSSIKSELSTLKSEMKANISNANLSHEAIDAPIASKKAETPTSDEENTGFFSDDDSDETIALTGDELNNILITADFTEKQADEEDFIPQSLDQEPISNSENEELDGADFKIPEALDESLVTNDEDDLMDDSNLIRTLPTETISTIDEDVSYLEEKDGVVIDDTPEDYIDIPDFNNEDVEEPNLDNFDLTISELELPNGQSIALGKPDENIKAIDTGEFDDISFDDSIIDNEAEIDITAEIEPNVTDEEEIFDANELDSATEEIPHLDLETNTAEKHKLDLPESDEPSAPSAMSDTPVPPVMNKQETLPIHLKEEIKSVLSYMDQLLESLPENKIEEFAKSEYFDTYKRLFDELGIS